MTKLLRPLTCSIGGARPFWPRISPALDFALVVPHFPDVGAPSALTVAIGVFDMVNGIVAWGVVAIASAIMGAIMANWKNRDYSAWAAWCFLMPPLLIALLLTPKNKGPTPRQPTLDQLDRRDI